MQTLSHVWLIAYDSKWQTSTGSKTCYRKQNPDGTWTGVTDIDQATHFATSDEAMRNAKRLTHGRPRIERHAVVTTISQQPEGQPFFVNA